MNLQLETLLVKRYQRIGEPSNEEISGFITIMNLHIYIADAVWIQTTENSPSTDIIITEVEWERIGYGIKSEDMVTSHEDSTNKEGYQTNT